ncbi:hypothetical protein [Dryocola clanedunensis]
MRKSTLAEAVVVTMIMGAVLVTVSSVSLLLLTHPGTMIFW